VTSATGEKMNKTQISLKLARKIVLNAQLLDGRTKLTKGKEGIAQTVEKLGYVQVDTISVVQRAHHHTLWTRRPDYQPEMLDQLQRKDRRVFEYLGHAASYLPMSDYRYYLPKMRDFSEPKKKKDRQQREKYAPLMEHILERIRNEGPMSSKEFGFLPKNYQELDLKTALRFLFWNGDFLISERRGFQKVYDLPEHVLPEGIDTTFPDDDELGQFLVRRALSAYGLAQEKEICNHIHTPNKKTIAKALSNLTDSREVICVEVEGQKHRNYYALPKAIENSAKLRKKSPNLSLLSPFDNFIIQRERIKLLFGFDYALECFVSPPKRQYGYFVLPILWGEKFVGRLDTKADRKKKTFIVRNLAFEPNFNDFDEFIPSFAQKLRNFARFNQCEKIKLEKISPAEIKENLENTFE